MGLIRKFILWFRRRQALIQDLNKMSEMFDYIIKEKKEKLIELHQDKTYALVLDKHTDKEKQFAMYLWKNAMTQLEWTPPKLILINRNLVELEVNVKEKKKG